MPSRTPHPQRTLCAALSAEDTPVRRAGPRRFGWRGGPAPAPRDDGSAAHLPRLREAGIGQLFDAHSHWFPASVEQKIWRYFDAHYWPVTYRMPQVERLEAMARNGVSHFTVLTYAHRPGMATWLNEWVAEFAAGAPGAVPCGTFFPEPEAAADVRRCIESYRFRGFKLHLQVGGFDPAGPLLAPAFEQVEAAGLPVVLHIGSAPDAGPFTTPARLRTLLARYPRLKVVVAHMGAFEFDEYLAIVENHENVYLDTTMVFVGFDALGRFPHPLMARLEKAAHKVLFGSDFPTIPYPLTHAVEGVLDLPFGVAQKRAMLGETAARLFATGAP